MVLANHLGESGLGHYMTIIPTLFLIMILASLELPISVSKFVAEKDKMYYPVMLRYAFRLMTIVSLVGMTVIVLAYPFFPFSEMVDARLQWFLIAFVPIIAYASIARGYFMGTHQMGAIAFSNFLRKVVQLILLFMIFTQLNMTEPLAILVAIGMLISSELIVCLYLMLAFHRNWQKKKPQEDEWLDKVTIRRALMGISVPTTGLRLFHAMTHAVQPFFIKMTLILSGVAAVTANEQFGLVAGVALTIGFFPAFISHSLLMVLIPLVSEAQAKGNTDKLRRLVKKSLIVTASYAVPSVIVCLLFADPLTALFVKNGIAAHYLVLLWPYFVTHFFVIPLQAFLIGLGYVKATFWQTVWVTIVQFSCIWVLGFVFGLGMDGVLLALNISGVLLLALHAFSLIPILYPRGKTVLT